MIQRNFSFLLTALLALSHHALAASTSKVAGMEAFARARAALEVIIAGYVDPVAESQLLQGCSKASKAWAVNRINPAQADQLFSISQSITLNTLRQTFESAVKQYPDVIDESGMADACVQGMVDTLDKRTIYFTPQAFRDLVARGQGENAGLGVELGMRGNLAEVVWVIPGTPAERVQIRTGDRVLAIDGVSMENRSLDHIVLALRGKPDTTVRLTLARDGAKTSLQLEARRAVIRDSSMTAKRMRGAYLYVRIGSFQESTAARLVATLQQLSEASPPRGIVLDLRSSPGGILPAALGVAAAFLPRDRFIVSTKSQNKDQSMSFYARPEFYRSSREPDPFKDLPPTAKTVPLMVLVNRVTASGAEIVAGTLQDYRRASVIGERSMGVGTIQTIRQIDRDSAIEANVSQDGSPQQRRDRWNWHYARYRSCT